MTDENKTAADAEKFKGNASANAAANAKKAEAKATLAATRKRLAARIAAEMPQKRVELIGELIDKEGLKLRNTSNGRTYAKMHGIEAGARGGEATALINWGNAARRALLAEA